ALDVPARQRRAHVRAGVVDGVETVAAVEQGDQLAADRDRLALARLQVAHPAHGPELSHFARAPRRTEPHSSRHPYFTGVAPTIHLLRKFRAMFEIEQKYSVADFAAIEAKVRSWGAGEPVVQVESDHYFNAPDRDFASTGEAFRLRRIGGDNYLT